jgi:PBP1b-binding outer membrane lipoprotein LpoB
MQREFVRRSPAIMLLAVLLLTGCADEKAPVAVEARPQEGRLYDTQRSALEQAKETADFVGQRTQQFQKREKEID